MPIEFPLCTDCQYYHFNLESTPTCDAFPESIPDDVYANRIRHDHPIPGDHGLRFVRATLDEQEAKLHAAAAERKRQARKGRR